MYLQLRLVFCLFDAKIMSHLLRHPNAVPMSPPTELPAEEGKASIKSVYFCRPCCKCMVCLKDCILQICFTQKHLLPQTSCWIKHTLWQHVSSDREKWPIPLITHKQEQSSAFKWSVLHSQVLQIESVCELCMDDLGLCSAKAKHKLFLWSLSFIREKYLGLGCGAIWGSVG